MQFIATLWMPILLSAVFVFIMSSLIHMVLGYHANDFKKLPNEDQGMDTLRSLNLTPGMYGVPKPANMKEVRSPEFQAKMKKGPVMFLLVKPNTMGMTKNLIQWFVYSIVVGIFAAYIGIHTLAPDANYLMVFRIIGCATFMGYGLAIFQDAIWGARSWPATWKGAFDALLYALLTAGTFGWLWHACNAV
ncbi:MAG TPA: hypothetical protein VJ508_19840 [Saprospiraceae bacterium]|nr:hypothetical protein [Saprospiraceae bacterium]